MANFRSSNIVTALRTLQGNTRIAVLFEPLWGVPFVLCNFYLSLYMKSLGVTDREIGYLISLGFAAGAITSFLGGPLTDRLGRRKTTLVFDLIAWPTAYAVYIFSHSFWLFALGMLVNSVWRIVSVSWNLMVVEDADNEQRVAAFNLLNIATVATGILTPLAGLLVRLAGVVVAERALLAFAVVSIAVQVILRNHYFTETRAGRDILRRRQEARASGARRGGIIGSYRAAFAALRSREVLKVVCLVVLYMVFIPVGSFSSLYFAPYLTETLALGKATISLLGGLYSATLLVVLIVVVPLISGGNRLGNMLVGLALQMAALVMFVVIPAGNFALVALAVAIYAVGFSVFKPFMDSILAEVTEGRSRASIYALNNTFISLVGSGVAVLSGYLFSLWPPAVWIASTVILASCAAILFSLRRAELAPAQGPPVATAQGKAV